MSAGDAKRRVLVTGASGYLGGRVCSAIAARPDMLVLRASRQDKPVPGQPGSQLWIGVNDHGASLAEKLRGMDTIVHLAGASQADSQSDPLEAVNATIGGTVRLLNAAIAAGVRRFIYLSTAQVYGMPLVGRVDEHYLPRPTSPYAITRRAAEDFLLAAHATKSIQGIVLRLSNAIGVPATSRMGQWHLIGNDLCRQAAAGNVLRLATSGEQWRDFITLPEAVSGILHFIDLPAERIGDGLFNLGGNRPLRIRDVAERIAVRAESLFGRRLDIIRPEGPSVPRMDYCVEKARSTGFAPAGDLDGELDAILRFCDENFSPSSN